MSSLLGKLLPLNRASRPRLIMVGAALGAAIALAVTVAVATSDSGTDPLEDSGTGDPPAPGDIRFAFAPPVGTCLNWTRPDGSDIRPVSCAEAHLFEVTEVVDISDDYPAGTSRPDPGEFSEIAKKECAKGARTYLGKPLDPEGKFEVSALTPRDEDWRKGIRDLRCGLWRQGKGGSLQPTTGTAVAQDQSDVWASGTCLAIVDKTVGDPIRCSERHAYEMIAVVDLGKKFDEYPSTKEQETWLDIQCAKAAKTYTGGKKLPEKLTLSWDPLSKKSWRAGSKRVNCLVGALLDDKSGLAPITGSIAAEASPKKSAPTTSRTK